MPKAPRNVRALLMALPMALALVVFPTAGTAWAATVSFAPAVDYGVGTSPASVAVGDLDGDGDQDLAVANSTDNNVSVLLNAGNGTFAPQVTYGVGASPASVAVGDLDGDGDQDLAVANSIDNNVSVLLNAGDGTFAPQVTYGVGANPNSVVVADFDGDGDQDLATADALGNTVTVLLNAGDGTFGPGTTYGVGLVPFTVVAADLDGDGDQDLATADTLGNTVSVLLNNGDGTFATAVPYGVGTFPVSVAAADLNGDGRQDLITADAGDDQVSVLLNAGGGTFAGATPYPTGTAPAAVVAADLDGDGDQDLATADGASTVSVLLNNGSGVFAAPVPFPVGADPIALAAGDLDGDADQDLVTANFGAATVSVLLNTTNPATPVITSPADGAVLSDSTPTFTGTGEAGTTVTLLEGDTVLCSVVVAVDGSWSCTPAVALSDGPHTVLPRATNGIGNATDGTPITITIDTTAPTAPVITSPADGAVLSDSTPTFTGTGEPGTTVTLLEGDPVLCSAVVAVDGSWSCTPAVALSDGPHSILPRATDQFGRSTDGTPITITIDATGPTAPVITNPLNGAVLTESMPTFTGTGEPGTTVTLLEGDTVLCSAVVAVDGSWSCTPAVALSDGPHSILPRATDQFGRSTDGTPITITIDTALVITSPRDGDTIRSCPRPRSTDGRGRGGCLLSFTGTGETGRTITVMEGDRTICTALVDASGNWNCSGRVAKASGIHTFVAVATDPTGATTTSEPVTVTIELRHRPHHGRPHKGRPHRPHAAAP
ncbi:FG-GAP-like repeat-containing protein [Streptomyces sp. NPDC019396]|uniref:FG-GAP-like repeat-containing protein n=1 Tax=Streptomyces sp. NPDC019396 TaxID=3154687 RepID=UPI0033DA8EB1